MGSVPERMSQRRMRLSYNKHEKKSCMKFSKKIKKIIPESDLTEKKQTYKMTRNNVVFICADHIVTARTWKLGEYTGLRPKIPNLSKSRMYDDKYYV